MPANSLRPEMSISEFLQFWLTEEVLPGPEQKILDGYYRHYKKRFGPYIRGLFDNLSRTVHDEIDRRGGKVRLLDIGCGCGSEALFAALRHEDVEVVALDLNQKYLAAAQERKLYMERTSGRHLRCEFLPQTVFELDPGDGFDIVWMAQTFHHVEPREEFVPLVARLLRPGGLLVIVEDNAWHPLLQASVIRQRGFQPMRTFKTPDGREYPFAHERILTPGRMRRHFAGVGLVDHKIHLQQVFPNLPIPDGFKQAVEAALPRAFVPFFCRYIYSARKPLAE